MFWNSQELYPEPLRKNRWVLRLSDIEDNSLSIFSLKECSKPSLKINVSEHKLLNNTFKYPTTIKWNTITMKIVSLYDPFFGGEGDFTQEALYKSLRDPSNFKILKNLEKDKIVLNITIDQFNDAGGLIERWKLNNAFISSLEFGSLTYDNDDMIEITAQIDYDWAENKLEEDNEEIQNNLTPSGPSEQETNRAIISVPKGLEIVADDVTTNLQSIQLEPKPAESRIERQKRLAREAEERKLAEQAKEAQKHFDDLKTRSDLARSYDQKSTRAEKLEEQYKNNPTQENRQAAEIARKQAEIAEKAYLDSKGPEFAGYNEALEKEDAARKDFEAKEAALKNPDLTQDQRNKLIEERNDARFSYENAKDDTRNAEENFKDTQPSGENLRQIKQEAASESQAARSNYGTRGYGTTGDEKSEYFVGPPSPMGPQSPYSDLPPAEGLASSSQPESSKSEDLPPEILVPPEPSSSSDNMAKRADTANASMAAGADAANVSMTRGADAANAAMTSQADAANAAMTNQADAANANMLKQASEGKVGAVVTTEKVTKKQAEEQRAADRAAAEAERQALKSDPFASFK